MPEIEAVYFLTQATLSLMDLTSKNSKRLCKTVLKKKGQIQLKDAEKKMGVADFSPQLPAFISESESRY